MGVQATKKSGKQEKDWVSRREMQPAHTPGPITGAILTPILGSTFVQHCPRLGRLAVSRDID